MAQFCRKCGAPQAEGMKFCIHCGAALGEPSAPTAPSPATPDPIVAAAQPSFADVPIMASAAPAAAPSSGRPLVKIALIVLAVIFFFGLLSIGACVYFVYRAKQRVTQFERQIHASYPRLSGTRRVPTQPGTPAQAPVLDVGALLYPGATPVEASMEMSRVKVQQYTTSDSFDKVVAFYRDKLGAQATVTESGGSALVQVVGSNGVINVAIGPDSSSGKTTITINDLTR